ncbi:hypothetical protein PMAYCL1PPCAC_24791, partial [Pristionchus mayeri]
RPFRTTLALLQTNAQIIPLTSISGDHRQSPSDHSCKDETFPASNRITPSGVLFVSPSSIFSSGGAIM